MRCVILLTRRQNEWLRVLNEQNQWNDVPLPDAEPRALTRMMGAFIDAVLQGQPGPADASFAAGLHTQRAIEAAIRSARERHWINVEA